MDKLRNGPALRLFVLSVCVLTGAYADDDGDVVTEWNELLQTNLAVSPLLNPRHYAMMHIAMFDAVNSIEQRYGPYHAEVPATPGASAEAAAAQAAHDVLVALLPDAEDTFDEALESRLEDIPSGRAMQGVEAGREAARAVLEWREDDGYSDPNTEYVLPALPGLWQPTPDDQVAAFANIGDVEPFGLITPTQYLPDPPPVLTSAEYATDFQEVQELGEADSTVRTAEQTETALLHAVLATSTTPFMMWNDAAQQFADERSLSLVDTARVFALLNAAIHDGLQTSHTSKFVYGFWRPVTAIRMADDDLNDDTTADPDWEPLLATPPYPSHSSNLTCIAASAARSLERLFDTEDSSFTLTFEAPMNGAEVTRTYDSFAALADEAGRSRIYGGIHFAFELTDSHESCRKVADWVLDNYAVPQE